jgi:hypothetical protein
MVSSRREPKEEEDEEEGEGEEDMARGKVNERDVEEDALMMGEGVEKVEILEMEKEEEERVGEELLLLFLKVKRGRVKVFAIDDDDDAIVQFSFVKVFCSLNERSINFVLFKSHIRQNLLRSNIVRGRGLTALQKLRKENICLP